MQDVFQIPPGPFPRTAHLVRDTQKLFSFSSNLVTLRAYVTPAVLLNPSLVNSVSMAWFTLCLQNSLATRTPFLIALALERPWHTMVIPLIPSNGAPPYSE